MNENSIPRYAPLTDMILKLNGTDDYVSIPTAPDINFGTHDDFTVEFWAMANATQLFTKNGDNDMVEKWGGGSSHSTAGYPYVIRYLNQTVANNDGKVLAARFDDANNPIVISTAKINDGQFHHIAFVRSGGQQGQLILYIDGKPQGEPVPDTTTGDTTNDSPLYLGRRGPASPDSNFFAGQIGRLRIWGRALDKEEVDNYMYRTFAGPKDGKKLMLSEKLAGDWRCNEGFSKSIFDFAKSNNGTLGGTDGETAEPQWTVSTILTPPQFIVDATPLQQTASAIEFVSLPMLVAGAAGQETGVKPKATTEPTPKATSKAPARAKKGTK